MKYLWLFGLCLISGTVFAGKDLDKEAFRISSFNGDIISQSKIARSKIEQIEYAELSKSDRNSLLVELNKIEQRNLIAEDSLKAQETANLILEKAFHDSKLVCTFETPLGSNKKKRICITAAAKKRMHEETNRNKDGLLDQNKSSHVIQN